MNMMFESVMSDWTLSQPILYDNTMTEAAEAIAKSAETDTLAAEEEQPEHDDWAKRDSWYTPSDQNQHQHQQDDDQNQQGTRSGLEPKVIGLLVNIYRYGGRASDVSLWDRVRRSADKLYYTRPNIGKQVDRSMRHR